MTSSEVVFNPLLPEFHANPYPFYRRLREADPVHHSTLGIWVLTRYDDVVMVLRDPRFGREGMAELMEARLGIPARPANTRDMLFRDPPDHTRLRALVSRAFTPRVVEAMRPHIQEIVDGFGIHFCLGAPLARIEGQVAIGTLLRRMPALKVLSDTPEWRESSVLRGLKTLPVTF